MLTLYDFLPSGNGYKVRLLLSQLGIPFKLVEKDILKGETRTPEFLAINPDGRIPTVQFDDGRILAQSNAIMFYFAEGTRFLPADRFERAEALQWMFFEQYSHEPYIAVARFWIHELHKRLEWAERLKEKWQKGYQALDVMERRLRDHAFLAGKAYSIADIALYAYTHVAEEGDFDLGRYPAIRAWLDRVADQPGHVLITQGDFGP
ncbi:MAG TPA: glutathione S-transferase family protein [Verrucomicrobiae bacterium]|nr:glutathione S-transferase family protein [Verrucomicrobiae bacterium]